MTLFLLHWELHGKGLHFCLELNEIVIIEVIAKFRFEVCELFVSFF